MEHKTKAWYSIFMSKQVKGSKQLIMGLLLVLVIGFLYVLIQGTGDTGKNATPSPLSEQLSDTDPEKGIYVNKTHRYELRIIPEMPIEEGDQDNVILGFQFDSLSPGFVLVQAIGRENLDGHTATVSELLATCEEIEETEINTWPARSLNCPLEGQAVSVKTYFVDHNGELFGLSYIRDYTPGDDNFEQIIHSLRFFP